MSSIELLDKKLTNDYYNKDRIRAIMLTVEEKINMLSDELDKLKKLSREKIKPEKTKLSYNNVIADKSKMACILNLVQEYKGEKITTATFHKLVKNKCNISAQQIKIIILSMGYDIKQVNGTRTYYF